VFRAGLLFGPHDPSERSGYWPMRMARGGEVLAPGRPARPVQLVDTRDVAAWMVRIAETRTPGIFNATGPDRTLTMGEFLDACRAAAGGDASLTWVDEELLLAEKVEAFSELPLWVPEAYHAFQTVDCRRAFAAGLGFRPLADSARDTLAWARTAPERPGPKAGVVIPAAMTGDREAELLARWHALRGA
jgi:nucleoside-diphosphate-sugar epimerase